MAQLAQVIVMPHVSRLAPESAPTSSAAPRAAASSAPVGLAVVDRGAVAAAQSLSPQSLSSHERRELRASIARERAASEGSLADLRLTRRGRVVLWTLALVCVFVAALLGGRAFAGAPADDQAVVPYLIAQGETLWSVASSIAHPGEDVRDVVDLIVGINDRPNLALYEGERILLPVR